MSKYSRIRPSPSLPTSLPAPSELALDTRRSPRRSDRPREVSLLRAGRLAFAVRDRADAALPAPPSIVRDPRHCGNREQPQKQLPALDPRDANCMTILAPHRGHRTASSVTGTLRKSRAGRRRRQVRTAQAARHHSAGMPGRPWSAHTHALTHALGGGNGRQSRVRADRGAHMVHVSAARRRLAIQKTASAGWVANRPKRRCTDVRSGAVCQQHGFLYGLTAGECGAFPLA